MKFVAFVVLLVTTYIVYGLYLAQFALNTGPLKKETNNGFYDYRGVLNVHSQLSIGKGQLPDILKAAKENQLDFLVMTDLNLYEQPPYQSGYSNGVLLLVEDKWSYSDSRVMQLFHETDSSMRSAGQVQAQLSDLLTTRKKDPSAG